MQRGDQADMRDAIEAGERRLGESLVQVADRTPIDLAVAAVDFADQGGELGLELARAGTVDRPASDVVPTDQLPVLEALQAEFEGKTAKQKNPHPRHSIAWLAWIIARLGGWTGYAIRQGAQVGLGVRTAAIYRLNEQGNLPQTSNTLDMAIQGNGYFQVTMPDGETAYTRDGTFSLAAENVRRSYGDSIDLTVFRCVQESLTNAIRHAQAKKVIVQLGQAKDEAQLELSVRDDGRGVVPGAPPGFGIRGMQERVEGLGGRFTIESASGGGTCVRVAVPLLEHRSAPSLVADAGDGAQA